MNVLVFDCIFILSGNKEGTRQLASKTGQNCTSFHVNRDMYNLSSNFPPKYRNANAKSADVASPKRPCQNSPGNCSGRWPFVKVLACSRGVDSEIEITRGPSTGCITDQISGYKRIILALTFAFSIRGRFARLGPASDEWGWLVVAASFTWM